MSTLPPCPIEGCTSVRDHHWHTWLDGLELGCPGGWLCEKITNPQHRCYSRPARALMLSLPTVAALVEAARAEGWERGYQAAHDFDDTFFEWVG